MVSMHIRCLIIDDIPYSHGQKPWEFLLINISIFRESAYNKIN